MSATASPPAKTEPKILFQTFFKSVGPRTYAAQIKELANGNQLLVFIEGKRDEKTGAVHKSKVFIFSEDFSAFFRMLNETASFLRAHPMPESVRQRREKFWARKAENLKPQMHADSHGSKQKPN
jgi:hypothetical protein